MKDRRKSLRRIPEKIAKSWKMYCTLHFLNDQLLCFFGRPRKLLFAWNRSFRSDSETYCTARWWHSSERQENVLLHVNPVHGIRKNSETTTTNFARVFCTNKLLSEFDYRSLHLSGRSYPTWLSLLVVCCHLPYLVELSTFIKQTTSKRASSLIFRIILKYTIENLCLICFRNMYDWDFILLILNRENY